MWILGMMFFVSCSDDDNGGTGSGNGDKDAYSVTILTQPYSGLSSTTVEVSGTCTITGTVPEVYAYGFVYGTSKSPEAGNEGVVKVQVGMSETGDFKTTLEGLTPNTTYYYRAYFEKDGAYEYGNTKTFTMKPADDGIDVPTAGELVNGPRVIGMRLHRSRPAFCADGAILRALSSTKGLLILMTFMCLLPDVMSIMPG